MLSWHCRAKLLPVAAWRLNWRPCCTHLPVHCFLWKTGRFEDLAALGVAGVFRTGVAGLGARVAGATACMEVGEVGEEGGHVAGGARLLVRGRWRRGGQQQQCKQRAW